MKPASPRKIIWSIDVFGEDPGSWQSGQVRLLKELGVGRKIEVEPVYVLSPDGLNVPFQLNQEWAKKYARGAENAMKGLLKDLSPDGLRPPKILVQNSPSQTQSARALAAYAKRQGADLICLGTHARSGIPRLLLGSFAESVLRESKVPLLISHPKGSPKPIKKILFPTDLERTAIGVFRRVVAMASDLGAEIVVLHVLTNPVEPVIQSGVYLVGGGWVSFESYRERELANKEREAKDWVSEAKKAGVRCHVSIPPAEGTVTQTILKEAAHQNCQLIAMAAQSGRIAATLIGSVARQVVRASDLPVWVIQRGRRRNDHMINSNFR